MRMRIRTRLTLASAGPVAVVLLATGVFVHARFESDLLDAVDAGLRSRADALLAAPDGPSVTEQPPAGTLVEADDAFAQILTVDGRVLESSPGLLGGPVIGTEELAAPSEPSFVETTVRTTEEAVPARILAVPIDAGRVLAVGASLDDQREALGRLALTLALGGPIALVLVVAVVWLIVGAALRPVEEMRTEAAAISASEPGRRLPVPETGDELARLGVTLNAMLDRLEEALERERRFVDDASHELRTPLSNLRAELDLALRRSRTVEELERALRSASDETDRLVRLAEDLLVLARAEGARLPVRREEVDAGELVRDIVGGFAGRASQRGISLEHRSDEDVRASMDPLRIRQALGNLLENALRHTPPNGRVSIDMTRRDGELTIGVADTGPGFSPPFVSRAFEPFSRDDSGRTRTDGGAGLGLAIVRAIAEAHGGSVQARNLPEGGAEVILRIPASP
jgi:two-component system OmpR family sensor kinase